MRINQKGGKQERETRCSSQGIDGLELVCDMFPRLRVGPVGVRVEVDVPEVDTAPFGDRADPPIRTNGFCGGGSFVPGSGQAGDGVHGHTQVNRLASGLPGPSVVIEFNAQGHGPEVDAWEGGAPPFQSC